MAKLLFLGGSFMAKCCLPHEAEFGATLRPYFINTGDFATIGILYGMLIVVRVLPQTEAPAVGALCVTWVDGQRYLLRLHHADEDSVWLDSGKGCKKFGKEQVLFEGVALYACSCNLRKALCNPVPLDAETGLAMFRETVGMMRWHTDEHGYHIPSDEMRSWISLLGSDPDAWAGWGWIDFLHPDDRDAYLFRWSESIETGKPYLNQGRILIGRMWLYMVLSANSVRDASGRILRWEGFLHLEAIETRMRA